MAQTHASSALPPSTKCCNRRRPRASHWPGVNAGEQPCSAFLPSRLQASLKMELLKNSSHADAWPYTGANRGHGVCLCCGVGVNPAGQAERPVLPFCNRCVSGKCLKCRSWVLVERWKRDPTFNLIGRPRGPQMPCGWGCGAWLTEHQMRAHFTRCPKRPAAADRVAGKNTAQEDAKTKRGRPPGSRMLCGWRCGAQLTATRMRTHFAECSRRPRA